MLIGNYKENYKSDEAIFRTMRSRIWFGFLLLLIISFPFVGNDYHIYMACIIGINIIAATGINILTGYTGLISLGHAAFMGIGAYSVAWLSNNLGLPFVLCLPLGGLIAASIGILVGIPSLRIKGLYLAIATLAAQFILGFIFNEWDSVTGGGRGTSLSPAEIFGIKLDTEFELYWLILVVMILSLFFARNLFRTRIGRAFIAVRDRDISAEVMGINLLWTKLSAFALSSFYAGLAGGLMAYFFKVVTPDQYTFAVSIFILAAIVVGGMGTILGGILGAIFMTLIPELLGEISAAFGPSTLAFLSPAREVMFGLLIVGFLIFEPRGLAEIWRRTKRVYEIWPFKT
ncbi:MAG: branched-chain amino acid ABC transporter permease [Alphaproteobacteria bacterium]|nr:branched-chain amino acid ABC transporter permease [Alphaproteobacteria bacterium]